MARRRSHTRRTARSYPRGRIELHRGGYGFVQTAEGEFFVPRKNTRGAFPGDLVELAPMRGGGPHRGGNGQGKRRVARVTKVIERAHSQLIGYFRRSEPFGVVQPVDPLIPHDIFTQLSECEHIADGAIVRVAITTFPSHNTAATGQVIEVLGDEDDERVAIDLIVARNKLETSFSAAAEEQAKAAVVDADAALTSGYRDLRTRFVFTIDPADARDFDDAISLEKVKHLPGNQGEDDVPRSVSGAEGSGSYWCLGVHIADVSQYVPWESSLDLDARRRATSVYLVDRVIPMLPEKLSNDICSLRPHEDRRTMTVDLYLDDAGCVLHADVYPALICSQQRLSYEQAQEILQDQACASDYDCYDELVGRLRTLSHVASQREKRRHAAGGLDFQTVEAKVRLDEQGFPLAVELRQKTQATQLIEEAMIMANEAVARFLRDVQFPCIYRVHEQPAHDSLEALVPVLEEFGWYNRINSALFVAGNAHEVQKVLAAVQDRPEGALVTTLVLRAMKRAVYSEQLAPHYGLASTAYAHFTSPIRRYPDLVVHRMLKAALFGRPEKFDQEVKNLPWLAEHSSEMERIAERAARESQEAKIVELMEQQVGQKFSALISGVATFGLFVRLENTAEGVIEMADLGNEYFILDPVRHMVTGSDSNKRFRLGHHIAVRLVEADRRTCQLRFRPV